MNEAEIEYWNGKVGQYWAAEQERLDAAFAKLDSAFYKSVKISPGMTVLDVGCGCGASTLWLAQLTGRQGSVLGIDVSKPMLQIARVRANATHSHAQFLEADAAVEQLPQKFDIIFSRFGVMFFEDPVLAFSNLHKAARRTGSLAFLCWQNANENEWARSPLEIASPFFGRIDHPTPYEPGPFAFAEKAYVEKILTDTGFSNVRIAPMRSVMCMGINAEEAAELSMRIGLLGRNLRIQNIDRDAKAKIRQELIDYFIQQPAKLEMGAACWVATADC